MGCFRFSRSSSTKNKSEGSSSNIKNGSKSDDHKQSNPDTSNIVNQQLDLKETTPGNEEIKEVITSPSSKNASVEDSSPESSQAQTFSYQEMADATKNFKPSCLLGEGGFGKVYKGRLQRTNEVVAIKQLDRNGAQGMREFVVEVLTLGLADHPNLVKLIGYCTEGDQRMLVYEFMPLGSLESHIHDLKPNQPALDWNTRMKIAAGAAMGLEYLHDKMNPPIIYRDLKCSNILLGQDYHPKLSDFGLAKVGPAGDNTHVSTRVMGTYGYCAPDYAMTGQLTFKSDIYSFGVVLLELITGRKAIDYTRTRHEQNLVAWARPLFKDRKRFWEMADPAMKGQFPTRGLYQALAIAAMCLQEQPNLRPLVGDVVTALNYLATHKYASVRSMSIPGIKSDGDSSRSHNSEHIPTED